MILYLDACVRKDSRTRILSDYLANKITDDAVRIRLSDAEIYSLSEDQLSLRDSMIRSSDYSDSIFSNAKQFASADAVIIAAPFWDLSFPAVLKKYIESICVTGITFRYSENCIPQGLCKASDLYYVSTAGGMIFNDSYSYGYIRDLATNMFGIKNTHFIKAEGLDIVGADIDDILNGAKKEIDRLFL